MPQDLGHLSPLTPSPGASAPRGRRDLAPPGLVARVGREPAALASVASGCSGAPLPCPPKSNNCTEKVAFPSGAGRTAYALAVNVADAVGRWGIEKSGFLTLTFADHVLDPKEAQRRLHSLTTHVLRPRYGGAVRVYERQKSGRIHYHLLVNVGADIRTGFSFSAAADGDYRSASPALRSEWAFWRRTAKRYGFGRTELLPILSSAAAVGRYVGKYISKHFDSREERDAGVRLVSYVGPKVATVKFMWAGGAARSWRAGLEALVRDLALSGQIDSPTVEAMRRAYGQRWAWSWRDQIAARGVEVDKTTGEIHDYFSGGRERGGKGGGAVDSAVAVGSCKESHGGAAQSAGVISGAVGGEGAQRPIRNTYRAVRDMSGT
jgi:hypothetical protein